MLSRNEAKEDRKLSAMKRDHSKLICDISELTGLFTDTGNLDAFLQKIAEMTAAHMEADVCSIYLYYENSQELVLKATKGLSPTSIGQIRLKFGEGLTGKALAEMHPVCAGDAPSHPAFRFFPGIGEEKYRSFLAVPILRGQNRIGVMTLQSVHSDYFTPEDVNVFRAIASQMANTIEMAKLLMTIGEGAAAAVRATSGAGLKVVRGRVGSEGFAFGEAAVVGQTFREEVAIYEDLAESYTLEDFRRAVGETEVELGRMQKDIEDRLFDVASLIFSAQILMLKDRGFLSRIESMIESGTPPVKAVIAVVRYYFQRFESMPHEYIREKKFDIIDVGRRVLEKLTGTVGELGHFSGKVVLTRGMLPSDVLKMSSWNVAGIVLLSGGVTSHVAVLARSLNIPLVIADEPRLLALPAGTNILVDGHVGTIFIDPDEEVVSKFRETEQLRAQTAALKPALKPQTLTRDGVAVRLMANINLLGDVAVAREFLAEGIGLYRTEFPFIIRSDFPTEEEQYVIYRRLVEGMRGKEITFRTLDIGGDKILSYYDYGKEANPFLGLRSIRFSLKHRDIFTQQIRAILRAGADDPVRIMFPMISSLDELREAQALVRQCANQLEAENVPHQKSPRLGMMIELPSTLEIIDALAAETEFFSIGTNDLVQYMLAVDRTNEKVADLYLPHHPAVLRGIAKIADAGLRHGLDVSVCGDMAHDPCYMPFLIGVGIRKFSLDARYLPKIQESIAGLDSREAARLAADILACSSIESLSQFFPKCE